ncbi:hypothetical protein KCU65_g8141, partial [Aureobasidium melanogenum]
MPKKKKVDHRASAKHDTEDQSTSTASSSRPIVSSDHVNHDARTKRAMKRAAAKSKTTQPQPKTVSLLDLPLELLYMIFDHVASRDHLEDHCYTIQVVPEGDLRNNLVIHQPALLMVCSTLRAALSPYFYSTCSFHVKLQMRSLMSSTGDALTLRQLEDRLPLPDKLSFVKTTIDIHDLSTEGFDFSIFVQIAEMLFEQYRTEENGPKLVQLDWWLESTDPVLQCSCVRDLFNFWLVRLLDEVFEKVVTTAVETSENFQTFSAQLKRWLEEEREINSRSYSIKHTLRELMYVTEESWGGKAYVLDGFYDVCECVHSDDMDDDDEENDDDEQEHEDDKEEDADNEEEDED